MKVFSLALSCYNFASWWYPPSAINPVYITCAILAITRDNTSTNNSMLDEFKACVEAQWEEIEELEQA